MQIFWKWRIAKQMVEPTDGTSGNYRQRDWDLIIFCLWSKEVASWWNQHGSAWNIVKDSEDGREHSNSKRGLRKTQMEILILATPDPGFPQWSSRMVLTWQDYFCRNLCTSSSVTVSFTAKLSSNSIYKALLSPFKNSLRKQNKLRKICKS